MPNEESTNAPGPDGPAATGPLRFPEQSQDWRILETEILAMVRHELGDGLRRRLESMDVVQDIMGTLIEQQQSVDPTKIANFRSWLGRVVENRIRNLADFHSARRRDSAREVAELGDTDAPDTASATAEERAQASWDYQKLLRALNDLSAADRLVIMLRTYESLPWEQIAQRIGKPTPDAARMAFTRAMVQLTGRFQHLAIKE